MELVDMVACRVTALGRESSNLFCRTLLNSENRMTTQELQELGFTWEQLPSGRWNLSHLESFKVNGLTTIVTTRGKRMLTFEQKSQEDVAASIKKLEFIR